MDYRIIYKNTQTKEVFVYTQTDTGSASFYRFPAPAGLTKGEYQYYITNAGGDFILSQNDVRLSTIDGERIEVLDCGVAQVGKIARSVSSYDTIKTYKTYDGE